MGCLAGIKTNCGICKPQPHIGDWRNVSRGHVPFKCDYQMGKNILLRKVNNERYLKQCKGHKTTSALLNWPNFYFFWHFHGFTHLKWQAVQKHCKLVSSACYRARTPLRTCQHVWRAWVFGWDCVISFTIALGGQQWNDFGSTTGRWI